ncbi:MAG: GTP-binding protein [Phycisphaera sp.]|nr:GTP-binding protein [Phycisphaera sp.]
MWWVLAIPPAIWLGKKIIDAFDDEQVVNVHNDTPSVVPEPFPEKGDLTGRKVVVVGRTGAGKSSLINMLSGKDCLDVGSVASTTRWIEGVRITLANKQIVLVDTPGYGEAYTAEDYCARLVNWVEKHEDSVELLVLVLQADSKAHAEDYQLLRKVLGVKTQLPVMIILNQVDKILPSRDPFETSSWSSEKSRRTLKSRHIAEKIEEVHRQFGVEGYRVEPSVSLDDAFNRRRLRRMIAQHLNGTSTAD